jgi:hypothetical protein
MRGALSRGLAVGLLVCAAATGCTSETAGDDAGAGEQDGRGGDDAGGDVGVTDDTIKISLIATDLSLLSEQNLAPEIGNAQTTVEAVVDDLNTHGGVGGRQIELVPHVMAGADAVLNPDLGRQTCVQATEDDRPFAVVIAASVPAGVVQCVADDHDVLTIAMDSYPDSFYEGADGRLFALATHLSVGQDREYRAWPRILDEQGALDGKTIGIVRTDAAEQEEIVDGSLVPSLEDLGYDVAVESVLPCPEGSQTCEQHDTAIQRMRDADVDFVFLVAQLVGAQTIASADEVGYRPQWATIGNNVTDTVATIFGQASKDNYEGTWGLDAGFTDGTDEAAECNRIAVAGGADEFPPTSDGYNFTAVTCLQVQSLATAIDAIDGPVTQAATIEALENLGDVPMASGPPGSLGPDKHDAGDVVFLSRYTATSGVFEPVDDEAPIDVG